MTTSFYLLTFGPIGSSTLKAVPISVNSEATSDDYKVLYDNWKAFHRATNNDWSNLAKLYEATPHGLPYAYDLCCHGGFYFLYNFGHDKEIVESAKKWIHRSFDVVTLNVRSISLIDWVPPSPFQAIPLPDWISFELHNDHPTEKL